MLFHFVCCFETKPEKHDGTNKTEYYQLDNLFQARTNK